MSPSGSRWTTLTVQVSDIPPAVTVISAVPIATGVTTPALSTVANLVSLDDQVTVGLVALGGCTSAVRGFGAPPTFSVMVAGTVTEVTGMVVTVMVQAAVCPPQWR
jgi:hypothetical protein